MCHCTSGVQWRIIQFHFIVLKAVISVLQIFALFVSTTVTGRRTALHSFYSPLMTGVNTAIPSKFGLLTVLSRIRPPTLGEGRVQQIRHSVSKKRQLSAGGLPVTCWWTWPEWPAANRTSGLHEEKESDRRWWPRLGREAARNHTPRGVSTTSLHENVAQNKMSINN